MISFIEQYEHPAEPYELNPDWFLRDGLELALLAGNPACRGSGTWLDVSPRGNHGTFVNMDPATDWVHDGERAGVEFGGNFALNQVDMASPKSSIEFGTEPYAVSWWMKYTGDTAAQNYGIYRADSSYGASGGFGWWVRGDTGKLWGRHNSTNIIHETNGIFVADGVWHLITVTWDTATFVIYDNAQAYKTTATSDLYTPQWIWYLCRQGNEYYWGLLDMFVAAQRAWTAAEIKRLYEETKPGGYGTMLRPSCTPVCVRG